MKKVKRFPFEKVIVRRSTLIIISLLSFLVGLWCAKYNFRFAPWLLLAPLALSPLILSRKWYSLVIVIAIGLSLGLIRGEATQTEFAKYKPLVGQKVTLRGKVIDDASYNDRGETEFHINEIINDRVQLPGKVRVSGHVSPFGVERGDVVKVTGNIREGFGSYQASMGFANIEVLARDDSVLTKARNAFFSSIYTVLPEPQASLGLGFLVGLRALLPEDLLTQLSRTGLTHIVAVSGYNLTVLVRVARRSFMPISKYTATAISVGLIIFFLAITGLAPSIFRASVVAAFALAAWYYGRPIRPMMLLGLSGAITAGINPFLIWNDIGWWLSFTAFFGVLVLAPVITKRMFNKGGNELPMPIQIAIETTCAQIMALPIIMVIFGELSLISVFANVLIVPFIPIAMAATFVAGIAGIAVPAIAGWVAVPAKVLLVAMTSMIALLSNIPWALITVSINWYVVIAWYVAVLCVYWVIQRKLTSNQKSEIAQSNYLE